MESVTTDENPISTNKAARIYISKEYDVIDVPLGSKNPRANNWHLKKISLTNVDKYFPPNFRQNIGLITGERSGGLCDVDMDCPEARYLVPLYMPQTAMRSGRKSSPNSHYWYRIMTNAPAKSLQWVDPDLSDEDKAHKKRAMILECRYNTKDKGTQTLVYPSVHPSGELIVWHEGIDAEPTEIDGNVLVEYANVIAAITIVSRVWVEGIRQDLALALSGALLRNGWETGHIKRFITYVCKIAHDNDISERLNTIESTKEALANGEPATGFPTLGKFLSVKRLKKLHEWLSLVNQDGTELIETNDGNHLTDLGNALRLVKRFNGELLYNHSTGKWHVWDGKRYKVDDTREVWRKAIETVKAIPDEAVGKPSEQRKAIASFAQRSEGERQIRSMLELAKAIPDISITQTQLDRNPWLLNCQNGTVNLKTGELKPHDKSDLLTKICSVDYVATATSDLWDRFISDVFCADPDLVSYIQKAIGYSLTGLVTEQTLFFMYGIGSNGKSTFVEAIQALLKDYALKAPGTLIMDKWGSEGVPNDIADLPGTRFVVTSELGEGKRLDEVKVKDLTGGDTVSARFMRQDFFRFEPTHKLWIYGNHKPMIRGTDEGIWRRIPLIPFQANFVLGKNRDSNLKDRLKEPEHLRAILKWAIDGCLLWQREGLGVPKIVEEATQEYRKEQDRIGQWIDDECKLDSDARELANNLYTSYESWCSESGERQLTKTAFGIKLREKGLLNEKKGGKMYWLGIRLMTVKDDS